LFSKDRENQYLYNNDNLIENIPQINIDSNALNEFINKIYKIYKEDPKLFKKVFDDFDDRKEGVLDQKNMRQAFSSLNIELSNDEWLILAKYYFREKEYLDNRLQKPLVFSYLVFLQDVERVPFKIHENYHQYRTNEKNREIYDMILKIINIYVIYYKFYIVFIYYLI